MKDDASVSELGSWVGDSVKRKLAMERKIRVVKHRIDLRGYKILWAYILKNGDDTDKRCG